MTTAKDLGMCQIWHVAQLIVDIIYKLENCVKTLPKFSEINKTFQD